MTTLTDRYVWAVLRAVPEAQRPDLEAEIRALVADAVEAQAAEGTPPEAAERAALIELGDPDALAGRYTDRIRHLIGPRVYPEWRRLLGILLPIVVPIVTVVLVGTTYVGGGTIGESIAAGLSAGFNVAVQTLFWVTLVFAVIGGAAVLPERSEPDELPQVPAPDRVGIGETGASIAANVFVIVAIVWQQVQVPIVLEGQAYPLFDPALWSSWLPWFLVVAGLEIAFAIVLYGRGRWTWAFALVNALLAAAFAVPAVWLLQNDLLSIRAGRPTGHDDRGHLVGHGHADHHDRRRDGHRLGCDRRLPEGLPHRPPGGVVAATG
jgi:hypothetical protein